MKGLRFLLGFLVVLCEPVHAQLQSQGSPITLNPPAFLVKDIAGSPTPDSPIGLWSFAQISGTYLFPAYDGLHGVELWRTDGTPGGSALVKDICPGFCSGFPVGPTVFDGRVYFRASDGDHGSELWRTDGTAAGTEMVVDLEPGFAGTDPTELVPLGGRLLFQATTGGAQQVWSTDGTAAGSELLVTMAVNDQVAPIVEVGAVAFIGTPDTLWKTDGTSAGTELVANVGVRADNQSPGFRVRTAVAYGNLLLFNSWPSGNLWRSDGTNAGTVEIHTVDDPLNFLEYQGGVYFSGSDSNGRELWRTDGTTIGTQLVKNIEPSFGSSNPRLLSVVGNELLFSAFQMSTGTELWRTDGTESGTVLVADVNAGSPSGLLYSSLFGVAVVTNQLFFFADDGSHGLEPWVSDGTGPGTHIVSDVANGSRGSVFANWGLSVPYATPTSVLSMLWDDERGLSVWSLDDTPSGVQLVVDPNEQASSMPEVFIWHIAEFADWSGRLVGNFDDRTHGYEPWVSDATPSGTRLIADLQPGAGWSRALNFTPTARGLFFNEGVWETYWFVNPETMESTSLIDLPSACCPQPAAFGADAMLAAGPLYRSNGTAAGTTRLTPLGLVVTEPHTLGDKVLFPASWGPYPAPSDLWISNGTATGTAQLTNSAAGGPQFPGQFFGNVGGAAIFWGSSSGTGQEPWRTDGTVDGTYMLADVRPGSDSSYAGPFSIPASQQFLSDGNQAFILLNDGVHGSEFWVTDGTSAGTHLFVDVVPGPDSCFSPSFELFNGRLFFVCGDVAHGRELWVSDGTDPGTHLFVDLNPGPAGSQPSSLKSIDGRLFFSATSGPSGVELWSTDGTPEGTVLEDDIFGGSDSSTPEFLTPSGPYLYFTANDGTHGFELWAKTIPSRALKPSSIHVDDTLANANGLWELGESVKLQPVWENLSISNITSVTATGAGSNGATLGDGSASYGTFAPLDLRSCLSTGNCYAATLAGTRPSTHWDVSLHETLSTGKVFDWPIHIAGSFDDIAADDAAYSDVEALLHANLTAGCSATSFCPQDVVTRAQAALFISIGLAGGNANLVPFTGTVPGKGAYDCTQDGASVFTDVDPEDPFCRFVHDLAAREITLGCGDETFCPENAIFRAQAALLLGKALAQGAIPLSFAGPGGSYDCSPGTADIHFTDVAEDHPFCAAAHYLWARQVSSGCDATHFCPEVAVTRILAADWLVTAFGLQLP